MGCCSTSVKEFDDLVEKGHIHAVIKQEIKKQVKDQLRTINYNIIEIQHNIVNMNDRLNYIDHIQQQKELEYPLTDEEQHTAP